jgi:hypothetical protein
LKELAERSGQAYLLLTLMWIDGVLATLDGRLEEAVRIGQKACARGEQMEPAQLANETAIFAIARKLNVMDPFTVKPG